MFFLTACRTDVRFLYVGDDVSIDGCHGCGTLFSTIGCPPVLHFSVTLSSSSSSFDLVSFVSTTSSFAVRGALIFLRFSHFFLRMMMMLYL